MGTYLVNGIVKNIYVRKGSKAPAKESFETFFKQEINLDYYNYSEDPKSYSWTIKGEMFNSNFLEFLEEQFQLYYNEKESAKNVIEELKKTKSAQEIIELSDSRSLPNFQSVDASGYFRLKNTEGAYSGVSANYSLMGYFLDGKILMESYGHVFNYFETLIRLQRNKYPIVDCVKVMITD